MDGRRPTGIMYVNTHVDEPSKEAEYDTWYHHVHFPDVTEPGIFVDATMFHNASSPLPDGEGRFLAFYETYWDDVGAAGEAFARTVDALQRERRIHAGTVGKSFGIYRQHCLHFATDRRRRSQSVLAVHIEVADPDRRAAARDWYADTHIPEILAMGRYHTGSLNEFVPVEEFAEAARDMPLFIALYESDIGDPRALAAELVRAFPDGAPDFVQVRAASHFTRAPLSTGLGGAR